MRIMLLLLALCGFQACAAAVAVPELRHQLTDTSGLLSAEEKAALSQRLAALAQQSQAQVAVLVVPTSGDESIEQYATRVFDHWKLGDAQRNDGVLLLVAWQDRAVRIEVGYGLEGTITDAQAGRIIRESIIPAFKQNALARGLTQGVEQLGALLAPEAYPAAQFPTANGGPTDADRAFAFIWLACLWILPRSLFRNSNLAMRGLKSGLSITAICYVYSLFFYPETYPVGGLIAIAVISAAAIILITLAAKLLRFFGFRSRGGSGSSGGSSGGGFRGGGGSSGGGGASGRW
ncbi:TPM domain-containing protein [Entomohabitans teleogrylli]|uniref:TPM domain-containing protein n=1 Tax=Entomohabitans teleogrylli TaxID=1384589 RepID=UPI00073D2962|nr:TPM domain-containing protein [Entomohabitans teleogrylli]